MAIIEDYEALRSAILSGQHRPDLEGIILNRQGMLTWCCEREKKLNKQSHLKSLTNPPSTIRAEEHKPLIHAIVNMISCIYEGEYQYAQYARC